MWCPCVEQLHIGELSSWIGTGGSYICLVPSSGDHEILFVSHGRCPIVELSDVFLQVTCGYGVSATDVARWKLVSNVKLL